MCRLVVNILAEYFISFQKRATSLFVCKPRKVSWGRESNMASGISEISLWKEDYWTSLRIKKRVPIENEQIFELKGPLRRPTALKHPRNEDSVGDLRTN